MSLRAPFPKVFFGWILVGYLLLTQMLTIGFLFYGFGVLLDPMGATLGLTRGETSYGFSLFTLGIAVWSPVMAWWVERSGPRHPLLAGLLILATGLLYLGQTQSAAGYYFTMAVWLSLGVSAAAGVPGASLVVNWFRIRRGMALSLMSAGISLGGLCLAPAVGWLIPQVGWTRAILLPTVLLFIAFPIGLRLVRNRPEDMGLFRDGEAADVPDAVGAFPLDFGGVIRDPRFQIVAITYAICLSCMTSVLVHVVGIWTDLGMTTERASLSFALVAGIGMIGKPFFGWLADRVDVRVGAMASFLFLMLGTLAILWPSVWNVIPFVLFFGLGIGGAVPMQGAINGALYGREHFARVSGILMPWIVSVQAIFYAMTGFLHDRLHSYTPIFLGFAVLYAFSLWLLSRLDLGGATAPEGEIMDQNLQVL